MHALPFRTTPQRRARGFATTFLVALGLLFMALAAISMVANRATAASVQRATLSGPDLAIYNLAGTARLEPGTGSSVEAVITPAGRDADRLTVETRDLRGRRTLVVKYPSRSVIYPEMGRGSSTGIRVREDGTFGGDGGRRWDSGRERVRISGSGSGLEAHADLVVSVPRGQKLSLYLAAGDVTVTNVDGVLRVDTGAGAVNTRGTRGELVVDTGSGQVNVGGATGPVSVDTGSGDVNVAGVRGDRLVVDTGSGGIRARDLSVATLSCDTGSGAVELADVSARRIAVDTGSGSVEIALTAPCEEIVVDTGSGDVTVRVPRGFGAEVAFDSGSGDFRTDLPVTIQRRERGTFRGRVGEGGARVAVETGSGSLRLASAAR